MMLMGELKRIFSKAPILVIICIIIPLFAISASITGITKPTITTWSQEEMDALNTRLDNLVVVIQSGDDDYAISLRVDSFEPFVRALDEFTDPNLTLEMLRLRFDALNRSFLILDEHINEMFDGASRVLITQNDFDALQTWTRETRGYFGKDLYAESMTREELIEKRTGINHAWEKHYSERQGEHRIKQIINNNLTSITFSDSQKITLQNIYTEQIQPKRGTYGASAREVDFLGVACEFLELNIKSIQYRNQSKITRFQGYTDFHPSAAKDRIAVLQMMLDEDKASYEYSSPFVFGKVMHAETGTTPTDFVINNFELLSIPLIVLSCLIVMFCIYDDIKKNTIIPNLVSPKSRSKVIGAKMFACAIAITVVVAIFAVLFFATAAGLSGAASAPKVLMAFSGKAFTVAPSVVLMIYLLSLMFKLFFFAFITALLCVNAKNLRSIIIVSVGVAIFIIGLNALLTVVFPFVYYQYLPLLAIDFAGFFGIKFWLSRHIASTFILFTLPFMLLTMLLVIVATIRSFGKRDF